MERILRVSLALKWLTLVFLVGLVAVNAGFWLLFDPADEFYRNWLGNELFIQDVQVVSDSGLAVGLAALAHLPSIVLSALALVYLARLFSLYSGGVMFTAADVRCMKLGGVCLLSSQLYEIVSVPLTTLALTMDNPAGERFVSIGIGSPELADLAVAVAVVLVSWVMDEGRKLREEQELTV